MLPQMLPTYAGPYGLVLPGSSESKMIQQAAVQVAAAQGLKALSDYRQASGYSLFTRTPTSVSDAYFHAAYWQAVAARLLRNRTLATAAAKAHALGTARSALPGSTTFLRGSAADVAEVQQDAAARIQSAAGSNVTPSIAAVLSVLGGHADIGRIDTTREHESDRQIPGMGKNLMRPDDGDDGDSRPWWHYLMGAGALVGGAWLVTKIIRRRQRVSWEVA